MKNVSLPLLNLRTNAEPPLSSSTEAILYFDSTTGKIMASLGGSSYVVFGEGASGGSIVLGPDTVGSLELKNNAVENVNFRQSTGLSVIGRTSDTAGNIADIVAISDDQVLRRSGTAIGFGTIPQTSIVSLASDLNAKTTGAASSTDNTIARFDGTTGKLIQSSIISISDAGQIIGVTIPSATSHMANKNYVDSAASGAILGLNGDKGDIVVSGVGLTWTIDSNAINLSKLGTITTNSLLGRDSAGIGNVEVITLGLSLAMSGSGLLQRAALTGDITALAGSNVTTITNSSVSNAKLRNSDGLSVVGRSSNSTGEPADITANAFSGSVLRENGAGVIGFGTVNSVGIADGVVSYSKIQNLNTDRLLGRDTAGSGIVEEISLNSTLEFSGSGSIQRAALTGDVVSSAGSNTTTISNSAVTNVNLRDSVGLSVIGRSANSAGIVADIVATSGSGGVLREDGVGNIGFGLVFRSAIKNASIPHAKLRNSAPLSVMGNPTNLANAPVDIVAATDGYILRRLGTTLGFGVVPSDSVSVSSGAWDGYNIFSGAVNVQQAIDAIDSAVTMTPGPNKIVQALPEGVIDPNWLHNDCGNGSDGDLVVNGVVFLERDRQYKRITVLPGGVIVCDSASVSFASGWVFRAQIVDCRTADARWIRARSANTIIGPGIGSTGGNNSALATHYAGTVGGSGRAPNGTSGTTGVGGAGAAVTAAATVGGYNRGKGGNGGAGVSGAGGNGGAAPTGNASIEPTIPGSPSLMWASNALGGGAHTLSFGGAFGASGGAGAGDGVNSGGGSGCGGTGVKPLDIRIGILIAGSNTNAPMIDGRGSIGANGGTPPTGNCGGGGGGGGGAGTRIFVSIGQIISTGDIIGFIDASGGAGGTGGNGVGTGIGGTGGDGGGSGKIVYICRGLGTTTIVDNRASVATTATTATTITGTAGTAGIAATANLLT